MSSSIVEPILASKQFRPAWSQHLGARPQAIALAREKQWTLVLDNKDCLHLFNGTGKRQAQARLPAPAVGACCADDGSAYVAVGRGGETCWLAPDLSVRWQVNVGQRTLAAALDPFGRYLAVSDSKSRLHLFDGNGRRVVGFQTQRPLHHLAFVPEASCLVGSADYGFVACYDLTGLCLWRDGLVANIGALVVSGDGRKILLACFSEGLHCYDLSGKRNERLPVPEGCRLAALSFDGRTIVTAGLSERIYLFNSTGQRLGEHALDSPAVGLVLGALGENVTAALADGRILSFEIR